MEESRSRHDRDPFEIQSEGKLQPIVATLDLAHNTPGDVPDLILRWCEGHTNTSQEGVMNFDALTDDELNHLRTVSKLVSNPRAKWKEKPGHQLNYLLDRGSQSFDIYLRQNTLDALDFSCGLLIIKPDRTSLTLCRYNGSSHLHHDSHCHINYQFHIHLATELAILSGKKPEHFAKPTNRYTTLRGALYCLVRDCSVSGLEKTIPDEPDLFDNIL